MYLTSATGVVSPVFGLDYRLVVTGKLTIDTGWGS
jgi:hypothetical protein